MANGDLSGGGISGTVALPEPAREDWTRELVPKGARLDMANGNVVFDRVGIKWRWQLSWRLMTAANRNALQDAMLALTGGGTVTFVDWEGVSAPVQPLLSTLAITPVTLVDGTTRRFNVSITFEGV